MASWQASPFAGAQIDFSQLGKIPDAYYDAQNDALKRENMRQTMAHQQQVRGQANADRDALKSIAAEGFPRDAQGNPDYRAAAERVFQATGNVDAANKVAQMGKSWGTEATPLMRNLEAAGLQRGSPEYREALMNSLNKGEGGAPSNVREWEYFNKLSPEQQQQYLTMKRAERYLDAGTQFVRPNPVAPGEVVSTIPKDVAGAEAKKAEGKALGQARGDLSKVEAAAETTIRYIDAVLNDPNLGNVTGWQAAIPFTVNPKNIDTEERIAQLGGRAFLSAFESLKGGGQITEIEGKKATDALARITNLRQSDAGFKQALEDFKTEVLHLVNIARQRAGGGGVQPSAQQPETASTLMAPSTQLTPGVVEDGYRFKGGNPSDPSSWEPVR